MKNRSKNNDYYKFYEKFADYYDSFYHFKDYKSEAKKYRDLIKKYKQSPGKEMLDAACGTGNHFGFLKKYFNITGLDINPHMLKIARRKHPDIRYILADMRTFSTPKKFDVILCLFSSIAHLKTYFNLEKAVKRFSKHLKQGGVIIIEPFIDPDKCADNILDVFTVNERELKLVRMNTGRIKGGIAEYDFHTLAGTRGKINYFSEKVQLGLFEPKKVLSMLKQHGINAEYMISPKGYRGMYVGVKS